MIDRRTFIRRAIALGALSVGSYSWLMADPPQGVAEQAARILPRGLKQGDLIGLVTPGSPIDEKQLAETIGKLEGLGLRTTFNPTVLSQYGYFAGPDRERADELMQMFSSPEIDGIWCVRGGYGSIRILDLLDYTIIRENPKVFVGFSDITAIHAAIFRETGLVTYHGPLGISDFNHFSVKSLRKVLMEPEVPYTYPYRREQDTRENPEFDRYTIRGGEARGLLNGGNISVLESLIGTRFESDFENRIVFLEEVEEKTYRVDRMLFHLLSATNLNRAAGIVLGAFSECNINDEPRLTLREAITDLLTPLDIPVSYGLSFGHIDRMVTLPYGISARMDADRNSLELLEATVGKSK
jgi:muramoyltetrapeptide carboxypeptidase